MNLLDYIEKLRQEPEQKRKKILYVFVGVGMAVIILLWLVNLNSIFNNEVEIAVIDETKIENVSVSPVTVVMSKFSNLASFIVSQISSIGSGRVEVFSREKGDK